MVTLQRHDRPQPHSSDYIFRANRLQFDMGVSDWYALIVRDLIAPNNFIELVSSFYCAKLQVVTRLQKKISTKPKLVF